MKSHRHILKGILNFRSPVVLWECHCVCVAQIPIPGSRGWSTFPVVGFTFACVPVGLHITKVGDVAFLLGWSTSRSKKQNKIWTRIATLFIDICVIHVSNGAFYSYEPWCANSRLFWVQKNNGCKSPRLSLQAWSKLLGRPFNAIHKSTSTKKRQHVFSNGRVDLNMLD